jgi:hypothetical protein
MTDLLLIGDLVSGFAVTALSLLIFLYGTVQ